MRRVCGWWVVFVVGCILVCFVLFVDVFWGCSSCVIRILVRLGLVLIYRGMLFVSFRC